MFAICSFMTTPSPDAAASALPPLPLPPRPFGLRRIRQWLGQLADIGVGLAESVTDLSMYRRKNPTPNGRVEVDFARRLVVRAMRWIEALRVRLAAEAKAARGMKDPRSSDYDAPEELLPHLRPRPQRWEPIYAPQPDDGIGDRPTAEVVAQICADLGTAAEITRSPRAAAQIAEIAATARALLDGPDEAWKPLSVVRPPTPTASEATIAVLPLGVSPPPSANPLPQAGEGHQAPDSG
jgi:hypothetical protein